MTAALSARLAGARPEETRAVLLELAGRWPHMPVKTSLAFMALLDVGTEAAFLGAVVMLVPRGYGWGVGGPLEPDDPPGRAWVCKRGLPTLVHAQSPALALAAAIAGSVE